MAPLFNKSGGAGKKKKGKGKADDIAEEEPSVVVVTTADPPPPKQSLWKNILSKKSKDGDVVGHDFSKSKPWYKSLTGKRRDDHKSLHRSNSRRATVEDVSDAGYHQAPVSLTEGALKLYNDSVHSHDRHDRHDREDDYGYDATSTRQHTLVPGHGLTDRGLTERGTVLMLPDDHHRPDTGHYHQPSIAAPTPIRKSVALVDVDRRDDASSSGDHHHHGGAPLLVRNPSRSFRGSESGHSHRGYGSHPQAIIVEPSYNDGESPVMVGRPSGHYDHHPGLIQPRDSAYNRDSVAGSFRHTAMPAGDGGHPHAVRTLGHGHGHDGGPQIIRHGHNGGGMHRKPSLSGTGGPPSPRIVETPNGTFQEYSGNVILVVDEGVHLEIGNEIDGFIPYEEFLASPASRAPPPPREEVFVVQGGRNMIFQDEHGNELQELKADEHGNMVARSGTYQRNVDGSITIWR